jgi:hypothetical protein
MRPNFLARPASNTSDFLLRFPCRPSAFPLRCGPSGVPLCASAPPVKWVLRLVADTRNPFFQEMCIFCGRPHFLYKNRGLHVNYFAERLFEAALLLLTWVSSGRGNSRYSVIHRAIPKLNADSPCLREQFCGESGELCPDSPRLVENESFYAGASCADWQ